MSGNFPPGDSRGFPGAGGKSPFQRAGIESEKTPPKKKPERAPKPKKKEPEQAPKPRKKEPGYASKTKEKWAKWISKSGWMSQGTLVLLIVLLSIPGLLWAYELGLFGGGMRGGILKGRVLLPGTLQLTDTDAVLIGFLPIDEKGISASARASASNTSFECKGPESKGVPPGKYKITVKVVPYAGYKESEKRKEDFYAINKVNNPQNSKLTFDMERNSEQSITIDLVRGTVAKN